MAYIGHSPTNAGTFYILDDLTMGAGTTYGLAVGGVSVSPSADNLLITLDGVIQHPTDAYTVSGSNIVFASGPGSGVEFYGIIMGQSASTGQGSIGADELKVSGDGSSGQVLTSDGDGTFSWATDTENYLPLAGGTMSGAINLGSQNVTNGGTITGTFVGNITGNVTGNVSGTAAAGTLTGSTLASGVTASSLTSVGTLGNTTLQASGNSAYPLTINNSSGQAIGQFYADGSGDGGLYIKDSSGNTDVRLLTDGDSFFKGGNVGIGRTPTNKLDVNGAIGSWDNNTLNEANTIKMSFEGSNVGQIKAWGTDNSTGGILKLKTATANASVDNLGITIIGDGKVGINEASPKGMLDIDCSSLDAVADLDDPNDYAIVIRNNSTTDTGNGIAFTNDGADNVGGAILHIDKGSNNLGDLVFYTNANNSGNPSERMRIDSAGTIFQGTTSPTLHSSQRGIVFENGSLTNDITRGANKSITLAQNVAIDSGNTWAYLATDEASLYQQYAGNHYFYTCASGSAGADATLTSKLTILNAGNVGIGCTPSGKLDVKASSDTYIIRALGTNGNMAAQFGSTNTDEGYMDLADGGSTKVRIAASLASYFTGGNVGIGEDSPDYQLDVKANVDSWAQRIINTHGNAYGLFIKRSAGAGSSNTDRKYLQCEDNSAVRLIIYSNGNVVNANDSYGSTSDKRIKNSIADASSQWDDIKALKIRKFKKNEAGENAPYHIGVIAQELETSGMNGLIDESPAMEDQIRNNEEISEGDSVKSVKTSVLYMKALKALQEAMERIEALENA